MKPTAGMLRKRFSLAFGVVAIVTILASGPLPKILCFAKGFQICEVL